jgi:hypothetical protein
MLIEVEATTSATNVKVNHTQNNLAKKKEMNGNQPFRFMHRWM